MHKGTLLYIKYRITKHSFCRMKRSRSRDRRRGRGDSANGEVTVKDEPVDNGYEEQQVRAQEYDAAMSVKQEKGEEAARRPAQPED